MTAFFTWLYAVWAKWWVYFFYIVIGMIGKLSWDISRKRRITFLGMVSTVGLSGFVGYLSAVYCQNNDLEAKAGYIVPICTLLADKIITYLVLRIKWKELREAIFNPDK